MSLPEGTETVIDAALAEDLDGVGDITSRSIFDPTHVSMAAIVARTAGCVAGTEVARATFLSVDPAADVSVMVDDGALVDGGQRLIAVTAPTVSLLTAERVALNLLGRMSGIATATRAFVDAIAGTGAMITDTRKTTPGLRSLEKYAVTCGGGVNHRMGLYDAVLIKDNHIAAAGSITQAVADANARTPDDTLIEVEVDTLDQLAEVLTTAADRVLLDNMTPDQLREAVAMVDGRITTEASGGITLETVRTVAETGVDLISVGWLTHSAPTLDIALDVVETP